MCFDRSLLVSGCACCSHFVNVFASGPQPDWDPDIVAGLDDDFDFDNSENELEDDFVVQAMDGEVEYHENESELDKEQAGMAESRRFVSV